MKITWLGHSCFLLEDSKGTKLLTDPFDATLGYEIYKGSPDIVTISHQHFDHNYTRELTSNYKIVNRIGMSTIYDIPIKGIPSYHDKNKGAKRGENIIFTFTMDGYSVCHLGDLGHSLSNDDLRAIGSIDILFVPVGGNYTLDGKEASQVTKKINPKIVIPMHYKTSQVSLPLDGIEKFLMYMKNATKTGSNTLIIDDEMTDSLAVKILNFVQ
ncbi:MBL fold metallo-hydrolase [Clostridium estertheticum]|uniref:MBL fold metallo-hydrolase n=1 Tax=Clostridium estertheticum TaxID=238834 RepID=A0A7Y3WTK7_9CLOT|nr:MBL fold metallo-hydrolase [Clostridium estertheticum]MBW9171732.1 MBL fold metallo-hydrolase [Clostridium estertheticum]MCB2354924.1 MBL fold metallo-hydrolase [Clostridium estertheticum]NNU77100.1 MBL fold metallo-hydrolase [Clostridium estertheticum]WAG41161.1 MBL fold metallo-hydrolase [Clostridium estertheticum]WBL47815.1 MBL fold metallo-hydrolase [Clostridium estertheticum]